MTNVYEIDATTIDSEGIIIPKDLEDAPEAYSLSRSVRSDWAVKIVNDSDAPVDATNLVSTSDDSEFEEYAVDDELNTIQDGEVPENVGYTSGTTVAGFLAVELASDPGATEGTVKVVFNKRRTGG